MLPSFELAVIATGLLPEAAGELDAGEEAGVVADAGGDDDALPLDEPQAASASAAAAASATTPPNRPVIRMRFRVVIVMVRIAISTFS
jgi:hypothetical protein